MPVAKNDRLWCPYENLQNAGGCCKRGSTGTPAPRPGRCAGVNLEYASCQAMIRKLTLLALLILLLNSRAASGDHEGLRLLGTAWPEASAARIREIGRGVGVVFSPDLSVSGNCRF